jgi:magnesium-transporting ATPase (P-type)
MTLSTEESYIVDISGMVVGGVSFLCSVLTLVLIYFTRKWNGYLLLLTSMTVSQIFYDFNYMLRPLKPITACYITQFLDVVGGLGVSFWTNILAFVITYTVVLSQSINIFSLYPYFSLFAFVVPVTIGILAVSIPNTIEHSDDGPFGDCGYDRSASGDFIYNFYYWGRVLSVLLTIVLCSLTFYKIQKMSLLNIKTGHNSKDTNDSTNESKAILRTVKKMNYYAVAQVICRSGAAWNEFWFSNYSTYQSSLMAAFCSPSSGIFNFFIFMVSCPFFSS